MIEVLKTSEANNVNANEPPQAVANIQQTNPSEQPVN